MSVSVRRYAAALPFPLAVLLFTGTAPGLEAVGPQAWIERIPNGPEVLYLPQRSVPMFSCTVLAPSGSARESKATNGAAHYLEHLLFNGTTTRSRETIYADTDRLGAYNNASTQRERTVFQLLLPSENWREGLALQADMLRHSTLPAEMFEKEKGIILEELAKDRSNPQWEADRFTSRALWGDSARGLAVLGTEESISAMDPAAVATFYRECYRPRGMTIVVMGDFELDDARAEVTRLFGGDEQPETGIPPRPAFPRGRMLRAQSIEGLGGVQVRVNLPLPELSGDDFAAARLLESVLASGERTALARAIEAHGISASSVSASVDAGAPWSLLTLAADTEDGTDPALVARTLLTHLEALATHGPDPADLDAARREVVADEISLREKMHYWGLMRADVLGAAGPRVAATLAERVSDCPAEAVRALARAALTDGRLLATAVGTTANGESALPPASAADATWWPAAPGVAAPAPPPAALTTETTIRREVLADGTTLIVHASPDSRTFAAHVLLDRDGLESALGVPRGTTDVVHRAMELGSETRDEGQLRGQLARLGAKLKTTDSDWIPYDDYYFSPEYSYLRLETIDVYAADALELLADVMMHPRLDETTFEKAKGAAVARAAKDQGSASQVANRLFWRICGRPDLGGVYGDPKDLEKLTRDQARRAHGALIAPERTIVVLSGSWPADDLVAIGRRLFERPAPAAAAGKSGKERPAKERKTKLARKRHQEEKVGQEQSWIFVGSRLDERDEIPAEDLPALRLATSILSDRLADQLREREGLAYSIGASFRASPPIVRMSAGTRPTNLERMEAGMREVAAALVTAPPTEDALVGARNRGEGRDRMRRLARIGQAYALAMTEFAGEDPTRIDEQSNALADVAPEDVVRVAKHWLAFENPVTAIAR
ncbi:MAG: insulinase family protein [bacterium]